MNKLKSLLLVIATATVLSGCSEQYMADFPCDEYSEKIEVSIALMQGFRNQLFPAIAVVIMAKGLMDFTMKS